MTRRPGGAFGARAPLRLIAAAVFAIASTAACPGRPPERAAPAPAASPAAPPVLPAPTEIPMAESSATFEVPVVAHPTEPPVHPAAIAENRPADTPARCITIHVSPSSSSAYGLRGEVVQLVVRGQNGCSTHFGGAYFRVTAIGSDGQPVGSASGSFSSGFPPGGSAETLVAIPTKPSLVLTYRAEVMGY